MAQVRINVDCMPLENAYPSQLGVSYQKDPNLRIEIVEQELKAHLSDDQIVRAGHFAWVAIVSSISDEIASFVDDKKEVASSASDSNCKEGIAYSRPAFLRLVTPP